MPYRLATPQFKDILSRGAFTPDYFEMQRLIRQNGIYIFQYAAPNNKIKLIKINPHIQTLLYIYNVTKP